ncbi:MAG: hypothetical protein ACYS30_14375 [Planctomycetota bacterium]
MSSERSMFSFLEMLPQRAPISSGVPVSKSSTKRTRGSFSIPSSPGYREAKPPFSGPGADMDAVRCAAPAEAAAAKTIASVNCSAKRLAFISLLLRI